MEAAITINDISVTLDKKLVLSNVAAEIPAGSIVGLLGPSGSGKTTLIRAILGLQALSSGLITVLDQPAGRLDMKSDIGYVSQSPSVYLDLSVKANIDYFARLLNASSPDVSRVIEDVSLQPQVNNIVGQLSGGQRTRVSLAIALLGKPKVLILDEPTVGLDPVLRKQLWQKFRELRDQGVAILISSHVMDEAEKCDELLFIRNGRLLIADSKSAVLQKTKAASMEEAFLTLAQGVNDEH